MAQQKVTIKIPKDYNPRERVALGTEIIDFIIERSEKGKDKNNNNFPGYSKGYVKSLDFKIAGKSKKVDLTLSGEMLNSLTLLGHSSGEITVGYEKTDTLNNAKAEGNIKGTYGQKNAISGKQRDFLGIKGSDLESLLDKYPTSKNKRETNPDLLDTLLATAASRQLAEQFLNIPKGDGTIDKRKG